MKIKIDMKILLLPITICLACLFTGDLYGRRVHDIDNSATEKKGPNPFFVRQGRVMLVTDVEPQGWFIERIRNKAIDIPRLIEPPLQEAIEILYDKNILTTRCSANRKDINYGFAYIEGELNSLSEENRAVLNRITEEGAAEVEGLYFMLKVPVSDSTTVEEIRKMFIALANRFLMQQPIWIEKERFTWRGFKERYSVADDKDVIPIVERFGYYYDSRAGFIYLSREHYKKVEEYYRHR
ncbi:MAG: hypothetical protein PHQ54_05340 [Candidatus Omnitrophica bacterium]|nr:hypothetical protein [Candidatus Omnitrophota bacterium]